MKDLTSKMDLASKRSIYRQISDDVQGLDVLRILGEQSTQDTQRSSLAHPIRFTLLAYDRCISWPSTGTARPARKRSTFPAGIQTSFRISLELKRHSGRTIACLVSARGTPVPMKQRLAPLKQRLAPLWAELGSRSIR
jgi:hypothetical protein